MNSVQRLLHDRPAPAVFAARYLERIARLLKELDPASIAAFIETLVTAREHDARIFFIGNGGSAATASHFANDLALGTRSGRRPFRAISLTDNVAMITATANDHGYASIFTAQLRVLLVPGDVVVAISASGTSENVLDAVRFARERQATIVGLTGFDGGELRGLADVSVHVPTDKGEYGPVEDVHMLFDHLVTTYLCAMVANPQTVAL